MVHPIRLMPAVHKNQLLVRVLLHLSAHDVPLAVFVIAALPSRVGATLVLFGVAPSAHETPPLLLPFSSYPSAFVRFACRVATSSIEKL